LLAKKLGELVAGLPAEESGREFGRECALGLRIELGRERCMLFGKEPGKELSLLLGL